MNIFTTIPPLDASRAAQWQQPAVEDITFDAGGRACMSAASFALLPDYTHTDPSGVWLGKMWKRSLPHFDIDTQQRLQTWKLCWYAAAPNFPDSAVTISAPIKIIVGRQALIEL